MREREREVVGLRREVRSAKKKYYWVVKGKMLKQTVGETIYVTAHSRLVISLSLPTRVTCHVSISHIMHAHYGNHWAAVTSSRTRTSASSPSFIIPFFLFLFFLFLSYFFISITLSHSFYKKKISP